MKKCLLYVILLLLIGKPGFAQVKFGATLAEGGISYDFMNNDLITDVNLLRFNSFMFSDHLNINISGLNVQLHPSNWNNANFVILPVELGIAPWVKHSGDMYFFPFIIYGKGSWLVNSYGYNTFYGSGGIRLSLLFNPKDTKYFLPLSVYFEYTTSHELRIGISVDFAFVIMGLLAGSVLGIRF